MHIKPSLLAGVLAAIMIAAGSAGGFFIGQSTRMTDEAVAMRVSHAVGLRGAKAARDTKAAMTHQRHHDLAVLRRTARKLRRAYRKKMDDAFARGRTQGYSSGEADGRSQGYSSGHAQGYSSGRTDGLVEGSDSLTCSDDPDVWWLPGCSY